MLLTALIEWKQQLALQWWKPSSRAKRRFHRTRQGVLYVTESLEDRTLLSTLSGVVFNDANGNATQDAGERGLAGITVFLDANNSSTLDVGETSVLSGMDGSYAFDNLSAGQYIVRQGVPDGHRQTTPLAGGDRLFATTFFGPHRIQELDPTNGNILRDSVVTLPTPANNQFQGLALDGTTLFYLDNTSKILRSYNANTGANLANVNLFGALANRNIAGLEAMNGLLYMLDATTVTAAPNLIVFDPATSQFLNTFRLAGINVERGLAGFSEENLLVVATAENQFVFLNASNGQVVETRTFQASAGNDTVTGLAVIDSEIYATFNGRITDVFGRQGNYIRSIINPTESGGLASGTGGTGSHRVSLGSAQTISGLNFGNQSLQASISGTTFDDKNANGVRDPGESGLAGATVYLDQNNNGLLDQGDISTLTDADGNYRLEHLAPGAYTVREVAPTSFRQTTEGNDPGTFYGTAHIVGTGFLNYVEIDPLTGEVHRVGNALSAPLHGLVRTNSGEVYGIDGNTPDKLYRLNPNDGTLTLVGATGYEMTFGLAYDPVTDTIYGVGKPTANDNINYLLEIDRINGSVRQIGEGYVGLVATSGLTFDPVNRRVLAFDNLDDEFVAFDVDVHHTATGLNSALGINTFSLAYTPNGLVFGGAGSGLDENGNIMDQTLRTVDIGSGAVSTALVLSERTLLQSLDWSRDSLQYRFLLGGDEAINGVDFGNKSLIVNEPPVAEAGDGFVTFEGQGVRLNGGLSSDADGDPLTYRWDLDRDGAFDDAEGVTVNLTWSDLAALGLGDDGVYFISLEVSDGQLADTDESVIVVRQVAPSDIVLTVDPTMIDENNSTTVIGTFVDPGTADRHTVVINWGDNTTSTINLTGGERSFSSNHQYRDNGTYTITARVTDDDGRFSQSGSEVLKTVVLDFDDLFHTEDGITVPTVTEEGFYLDYPNHATAGFLVLGPEHPAYTGSPALATKFEDSFIELRRVGGGLFNVVSIDVSELAPLMSVYSPTTVSFFGQTAPMTFISAVVTTTDDHQFGMETFSMEGVNDISVLFWFSGTIADRTAHQFDNIVVQTREPGAPNPTVTVRNVPASNLSLSLEPPVIYENGTTILAGTFSDPGPLDVHTIVIHWGDGTSSPPIELPVGQRKFTASHQYLDDNALDRYAITVSLADDEGDGTSQTIDIGVQNTSPASLSLSLESAVIVENGTAELSGMFSDLGTLDSHTLIIDWGDGASSLPMVLPVGQRSFSFDHQYAAPGFHTISVSLADDDGGNVSQTIDVEVLAANEPPTSIGVSLNPSTISENGTTLLTGTFADPDGGDHHTILVSWGDGRSGTVNLTNGQRSFSFSHQYLDDNPLDRYTITVRVTDSEGENASASTNIAVQNAAPVINSLSTSAATIGNASTGQSVALLAAFTDPGTLDTFSVVIDWGDGTPTMGGSIASGQVQASHVYTQGGVYQINVTLLDDDGGSATASTLAYVTGLGIRGGVLQIVGTNQNDNVSVTTAKKGGPLVNASFLPTAGISINTSLFQTIEVFLGGGDDVFSINANYTQSLLVLGGAGADTITAGGARSLIIGGLGADKLTGGSNQDILITGITSFDNDILALRSILAEWNSSRTLQQRVGNLYNGTGSSTRLNGNRFLTVGAGGTVQDDTSVDQIQASGGTDWLFYHRGVDTISGKIRDDIFANDLDSLL